MKRFLAIYLGSADAMARYKAMEKTMKKEKDKAGMGAWRTWVEDNRGSITDMGSPLGKTKRVDMSGIADTRNDMGAWTVVEAESHDAAAKLFLNHPHFMIFPGESVEVMECLPIPEM